MNVDGLNHCALAHEIVDTTACGYCGALPGHRCCANRRDQDDPFLWRWLVPSASHRARIEAYWHAQSALNRD